LTVLESLTTLAETTDWAESVAMALAGVGRFDEATGLQSRAIEVARAAGRDGQARRMVERLERYRAGRTVDRPWSDEDPIFRPAAR
jgi:hypothetical protein